MNLESPYFSVVIPLFDERDTLRPLYEQICAALQPLERPFEILFVDDGSRDGSYDVLKKLHENDARVRVFRFRKNSGKSPSLAAGFDHVRGEIVFTMDADLQDDPAELPRLYHKLEEGFDLVSGWKRDRKDPLSKLIFSKFFNGIVGWFTGIKLHDFNCGLKAYRREVVDQLSVYGEMHRFLPVWAARYGFRVTELPVVHHPRRAGHSKFGMERILNGFLDFGTVLFITRSLKRPVHLLGRFGICFGLIGLLIFLFGAGAIALQHVVLGAVALGVGGLCILMGFQAIFLGLIAELITFYRREDEPPYYINERLDA
ncbi:MAG: glycosyltransferase family 2 protein [Candidatus Hinthialibacter antarcticus]|nr:glycosyltransferase family 2 protein [Candidatus Hinthialibacter antarcticus]